MNLQDAIYQAIHSAVHLSGPGLPEGGHERIVCGEGQLFEPAKEIPVNILYQELTVVCKQHMQHKCQPVCQLS